MIWTRFRQQPSRATIAALYGMIVAQARLPIFYRDYAVADTVNGRFDMIVLHLAVFLHRLKASGPDQGALGQAIFDAFCRDMDGNLREMGVGDLKVPKQMQQMGEAFYGRVRAYDAALSSPDEAALAATVARNIYSGETSSAARRLAAYIRACVDVLAGNEMTALTQDGPSFPDPGSITER